MTGRATRAEDVRPGDVLDVGGNRRMVKAVRRSKSDVRFTFEDGGLHLRVRRNDLVSVVA